MTTDAAARPRIADACICCGGRRLEESPAILMPFVAHGVLGRSGGTGTNILFQATSTLPQADDLSGKQSVDRVYEHRQHLAPNCRIV